MTDFKISIGMSTETIMKNAKKLSNGSKEIKNKIINFCNGDLDGKVTNDIELRLLNTYLSGQKEVKMPTPNGEGWIQSKSNPNTYEKRVGNNKYIYTVNKESGKAEFEIKDNSELFKTDHLLDLDGDGVADKRYTTELVSDKNCKNCLVQEYIDDDLDGNYERTPKMWYSS